MIKTPDKHAHGPLATKGARYAKPQAKATKKRIGRLAKRVMRHIAKSDTQD